MLSSWANFGTNMARTYLTRAAHAHAGLTATAIAAAGTAAWVAGRARRAEQRHPPAGQFIDVDGVRLHYVERGEGVPVVLLHGNVVMLQDFIASGIFDTLADRYRVIAFDRPGFGYSARPRNRLWTPDAQADLLLHAFMRLGIERPIVVGHSWATLVAVALALKSAVRRVVLVSGYYFPTLRIDAALVAPVALPVVGDVLRYTIAAVAARLSLRRTIETMFAPQPVPAGYLPVLHRELLLRPSQIRADAEEGTFLVPSAARFRDRYAELDVPAEIIAGAADRVVDPDAHSARLHRSLPDSTLRILPGAGHMLHHAHAPDVIAAVDGTRERTRASPAEFAPG
jgi:pimeloyl-ACP methyl ester carboxylesterase